MAHFFLFILVLTEYKLESHPVIKNKVEQVNLKIVELKILYIMLIYYDLLFGNTNLFFFYQNLYPLFNFICSFKISFN